MLLWFCNSWRSNGIPCCSIEIYPTYQLYGELFTQDESALQPAVPYIPSLSNRRTVLVLNVSFKSVFFFCAFQPKFRQEGHFEGFWITSVVSRVCYLHAIPTYFLLLFFFLFPMCFQSWTMKISLYFFFFSLHVIVSVFACYN